MRLSTLAASLSYGSATPQGLKDASYKTGTARRRSHAMSTRPNMAGALCDRIEEQDGELHFQLLKAIESEL
jgi:hypothetical protein